MKNGYNPEQLLRFCGASKFKYGSPKSYVSHILATIVVCKDPDELKTKLAEILYEVGTVSIASALDQLHSTVGIGPELDGGCTGLDALYYHLSRHTCQRAVDDLQAVIRYMDSQEKESK